MRYRSIHVTFRHIIAYTTTRILSTIRLRLRISIHKCYKSFTGINWDKNRLKTKISHFLSQPTWDKNGSSAIESPFVSHLTWDENRLKMLVSPFSSQVIPAFFWLNNGQLAFLSFKRQFDSYLTDYSRTILNSFKYNDLCNIKSIYNYPL